MVQTWGRFMLWLVGGYTTEHCFSMLRGFTMVRVYTVALPTQRVLKITRSCCIHLLRFQKCDGVRQLRPCLFRWQSAQQQTLLFPSACIPDSQLLPSQLQVCQVLSSTDRAARSKSAFMHIYPHGAARYDSTSGPANAVRIALK